MRAKRSSSGMIKGDDWRRVAARTMLVTLLVFHPVILPLNLPATWNMFHILVTFDVSHVSNPFPVKLDASLKTWLISVTFDVLKCD